MNAFNNDNVMTDTPVQSLLSLSGVGVEGVGGEEGLSGQQDKSLSRHNEVMILFHPADGAVAVDD